MASHRVCLLSKTRNGQLQYTKLPNRAPLLGNKTNVLVKIRAKSDFLHLNRPIERENALVTT